MGRCVSTARRHWDWRVSAHARLASLGLLWVAILGSPLLGPFVLPLIAIRFATSPAQLFLNTDLGRRRPLDGRTRLDWLLLVVTFIAACVSGQLHQNAQGAMAPLTLLPLLAPFSAIQLRAALRSYRAHDAAAAAVIRLRPASAARAAA
jgi:hypothetical protein